MDLERSERRDESVSQIIRRGEVQILITEEDTKLVSPGRSLETYEQLLLRRQGRG